MFAAILPPAGLIRMKQREVRDADDVRWVCVQAHGGSTPEAADAAAEHIEEEDGTLPVICTPTGGARSVRLSLPRGWEESMSDEALLHALSSAR